jgi:hypothetical protein
MRTVVFLVGIIMIALGPLITLLALSSCLGTILSGQFFACVADFAYVIFGGALFFIGVITAIIGAVASDSPPVISPNAMSPVAPVPLPAADVKCKKCGNVYKSDRFFCPSCGQRPH